MLVGFASGVINPESPTLLGGYPVEGLRYSEGVHDDLFVFAFSVRESTDSGRFVVLAFDGIAVPPDLAPALRSSVDASTELAVVASHSHAAPSVAAWDQAILGPSNYEYTDMLLERSKAVLSTAIASEAPGTVAVGQADLPEAVGTNRRHVAGPRDETVRVVSVESESGEVLGVMVIHGCHATILGEDNRLVSSDIAWGLRETLGDIPAAFLPGGAGDQSTRATRRSSSFDECRRLGGILGEAVKAALGARRRCERSRSTRTGVNLAPRTFPSVDEARRRLDTIVAEMDELGVEGSTGTRGRFLQVARYGAEHDLRRAEAGFSLDTLEAEVVLWDLGETALAFWPVEPTVGLANEVSSIGAWLCGYTNGYLGYLLQPEDHDRGGYELAASPFERAAANEFIEATRRLAGQLS